MCPFLLRFYHFHNLKPVPYKTWKMEVAYQVNRRKACDLCFFKKIKCDMLEPACSNCRLYKAECCTTRARKRFRSVRPQPVEPSGSSITPDHAVMASQDETRRIESIESRLARMEERIEQIIGATAAATTQSRETSFQATTALSPFPVPNQFPDQPPIHLDSEFNGILSQLSSVTHPIDLGASETLTSDKRWNNSYPHLPPFEEIQPIIENYFTHINSLMPLFSQTAFLCKLHDYYAAECQNPRKTWAAINIVLALGTRLPTSPSADLDLQNEDSQAAKYVSNVQSVLSELVTRDVDLLSLQIILGLVIIFNSLKDSSPAVVLIGTAIRLAHRLRLHSRDHQHNGCPNEALQRSRVFWIAYLFDKDICIRHHTPSVQADDDIDLDLPIDMPPDGAGNVYAKDGRFLVNFFRLRLRLAHVQGQVYDQLFSTRASKITPQERQRRVALLHNQLERWRLTIPSELQADVVTEHANRTTVFWLCMTHFSYLGCLVMIHGMWSHDAEWRKRLKPSSFGSDDIDRSKSLPPLPRGWKYCVQMSRHCMMLVYQAPLSDCSIWTNGCAYFSALIIILANLLENPLQKAVDDDLQLTNYAVGIFDRMSDASNIVQMKRLNIVAAELDRRARLVIKHARRFVAVNGSPPLERRHNREIDQGSPTGLQWDWGNEGVEAWPNMDVSLNDAYSSIIFGSEFSGAEFGPFDNWMELQMGKLFSTPQFSKSTGFSG
ncbi:fungal-specific transcription factor [Trichoderma velutinum]